MNRPVVLVALFGVLLGGLSARAEEDPARKKLEAAKAAYDIAMKEHKEAVLKWFSKEDETARKLATGATEKVKQVAAEKKLFEETGTLPKRAPTTLKDRPTKITDAIAKAFKSAADEYTRQKKDDQAEAVLKELEAFKNGAVSGSKAGEEREFEIARGVRMKFCWIPAGKATLGSPASEKERSDNEKEHPFETKGFWLGKYEVTQGEWEGVTGGNPSYFKGAKLPAEQVSWEDCQKFIGKCSIKGSKVKLPQEDEWEYACRGGKGNQQAFYWGDVLNGDKANCNSNFPYGTTTKGKYAEKPTEVGSYEKLAPHPWGLCDMHGNVLEWCENLSIPTDKARIIRGGGWDGLASLCRSAARYGVAPNHRAFAIGLRLVLVPSGE